MLIIISIATFFSTLLGGLFAIKFKDRLHLVLGFSAGAVIGVAFFDLMPEAIELGSKAFDISGITSIVAAGFILYMILDRFVMIMHMNTLHHAEVYLALAASPFTVFSMVSLLDWPSKYQLQ